jgi:hypothetical protein
MKAILPDLEQAPQSHVPPLSRRRDPHHRGHRPPHQNLVCSRQVTLLIAEVGRGNDPQLAGIWRDLIHTSLQQLARPSRNAPHLDNLWAYVNEFSYNQAFKRGFGLSPSAYRAKARSSQDAGGFA